MITLELKENASAGMLSVKRLKMRWLLAAVLIILAVAGVACNRMILWLVVQTCSANGRLFDVPFPCLEIDKMTADDLAGYAVLRAPFEATHIVVTPTVPISGIESPTLTASNAPNYIKHAWNMGHYVEEGLGRHLAWDEIGLAVNSRRGRSQDQLHIHVDCVDASVRKILRDSEEFVPGKWVHMKQQIQNIRYWALLLKAEDLDATNMFQLAATDLRIRPKDQSNLSLALLGTITSGDQRSFLLLADIDQRYRHRPAHTEYLLDHSCAGDK